LIKIYQSQGLNESALQSCAAILAVNPRDEEALSVQSALGGSLKQTKEPKRPKPGAPITRTLSNQQAAPEESTRPGAIPESTPLEPEIASTDPLNVTTEFTEADFGAQDQIGEQLAVAEPDSQAADAVLMPPPSLHAGVVVQLEAWLHTIASRRRDRDAANESHLKTS
jgi:hypothetical protein